MAKKKYTKFEKLHFINDHNESGLNLNEYCTRHHLNYFEFKAWRTNYKKKTTDAGQLTDTRQFNHLSKDSSKNILKVEHSNGLICFSTIEKKPAVLIKNKKKDLDFNKSIEDIFYFRDTINECCISLLDLHYTKSNIELVEQLIEVLN